MRPRCVSMPKSVLPFRTRTTLRLRSVSAAARGAEVSTCNHGSRMACLGDISGGRADRLLGKERSLFDVRSPRIDRQGAHCKQAADGFHARECSPSECVRVRDGAIGGHGRSRTPDNGCGDRGRPVACGKTLDGDDANHRDRRKSRLIELGSVSISTATLGTARARLTRRARAIFGFGWLLSKLGFPKGFPSERRSFIFPPSDIDSDDCVLNAKWRPLFWSCDAYKADRGGTVRMSAACYLLNGYK